MAYRIKTGESLRRAVARMPRAELAGAAEVIIDDKRPLDERVHELRTAIKRVRALTRLVRPHVGRPARRADRRLRKIARAVSAVRDAEVLLGTFDRLVADLPAPHGDSLVKARAQLAERLEKQSRPFKGDGEAVRLRRRLRKERRRVKRWTPSNNRWRVVGRGFADGYQRARRSMVRAYEGGASNADRDLAFHAWRRAVKAHRHQVHVLEAACPRRLKPRLDDLDRLGDLLGDEHDLTVLEETLRRERNCFTKPADCDRVLASLEDQRRQLRKVARPLGEKLFADRPRDFRRVAKADFRAFRHVKRRPTQPAHVPTANAA
jgi:CHAD domain-containing protein